MRNRVYISVLVVIAAVMPAGAGQWSVRNVVQLSQKTQSPSVWNTTVAYADIGGGEVFFFDGTESVQASDSALNWEPSNAGGIVAWRGWVTSPEPGNDIFRWDGEHAVNISNSPAATDSDVSAGGNGDVLWSENHTWLLYYDASADQVIRLNVKGERPSLWINSNGIATYAYQHPDTDEVYYYDGQCTHLVGQGAVYGAFPKLWDGAVVYCGEGMGGEFVSGEVFYWRDGQLHRLTDDDDGAPVADLYLVIWENRVVWVRFPSGLFLAGDLHIWDGVSIQSLDTPASRAALHADRLAWTRAEGLYLAELAPPFGDCDLDGMVGLDDWAIVADCVTGPAGGESAPGCGCADRDGDGDVDLQDLAALLLTGQEN